MIVKVVNERKGMKTRKYYSGDTIQVNYRPIEVLLHDLIHNNDCTFGVKKEDEKDIEAKKYGDTVFELVLLGADRKVRDLVLVYRCSIYIMNEDGKTIDKYISF